MTLNERLRDLTTADFVDLYEFDLRSIGIDSIRRYTPFSNNNGTVVSFGGVPYDAYPIKGEGYGATVKGQTPKPKLVIANVEGTLTALLKLYQDLLGVRVIRRRTLPEYLDGTGTADPTQQAAPDIHFVERKAAENKLYVTLELASPFEFNNIQVPGRVISRRCPWLYRGAECQYTGTAMFNEFDQPTTHPNQDICGKRVSSCQKRFGVNGILNHGGYPLG